METPFIRSKALNNIPIRKLNDWREAFIANCETCSKLANADSVDGLCKKCSVASIVFNRYYESNIPLEYWKLNMKDDFVGDKRLLEKYNELTSDIKKCFVDGTSICFAGNHGTGKSLNSNCILKVACQKGYTSLYTTFQDILTVLMQAPNDEKFLARKELSMIDFLVIDELDPRFVTNDNVADLYARQLENIIRTRRSNKLPTFMITNSPNVVETFNGALKQSIESIFAGYMNMFVVLGTDFRKKTQ